MPALVAAAISYVLGSIPAAYLAGRLTRGIDLREHGSGNLGATNVGRVLGWKIAAVVFAFDIAKGFVPTFFFPTWTTPGSYGSISPAILPLLYGVAAIVGHVRPIFLLWKGGGKGVATATGVFAAIAPIPTVIAIVVFLLAFLPTRYVALGSLSSAAALPVAVAVVYGLHSPILATSVLIAAFVFWTHRANIGRLRRGEEHRIGRKTSA